MRPVVRFSRATPNKEARQALRISTINIFQVLIGFAQTAKWPEDQLHVTLKELKDPAVANLVVPPTVLFSYALKKSDSPKTKRGWARFIGVDPRYLQADANLMYQLQSKHVARLHVALQQWKIVRRRPVRLDAYKKLEDRKKALDQFAEQVANFQQHKNEFVVDPHTAVGFATNLDTDKLVLIDPRIAGIKERGRSDFKHSLMAHAERDSFIGRKEDLKFLDRFVICTDDLGRLMPLAWSLVTGAGGEGKTRLAIEFFDKLESKDKRFEFGFLEAPNQTIPNGWKPTQPTLIVIDNGLQTPDVVASCLNALIRSHYETPFRHSVRVLLLEREEMSSWLYQTRMSDVGRGSIEFHRYCETPHSISPLPEDDLTRIALGRLDNISVDPKDLIDAIRRVDNRKVMVDGQRVSGPRPLFAAATGRAIAELVKEGGSIKQIVQKLERAKVLDSIIERERADYWCDPHTSDKVTESQRLRQHENLLLLATISLDLPRDRLLAVSADAKSLLPAREAVDNGRYRRMVGSSAEDRFRRLEPDILGEYFALSSLRDLPRDQRQILIDAALVCAGTKFSIFLQRCAVDFPALTKHLDYFPPSESAQPEAIFTYLTAASDIVLAELVPADEQDRIVRNIGGFNHEKYGRYHKIVDATKPVWLRSIREFDLETQYFPRTFDFSDRQLPEEQIAQALFNHAELVRRNEPEKYNGLTSSHMYLDVIARFSDCSNPLVYDLVTLSLLNRGRMYGIAGHIAQAIEEINVALRRSGLPSPRGFQALVCKAIVISFENAKSPELDDLVDDAISYLSYGGKSATNCMAALGGSMVDAGRYDLARKAFLSIGFEDRLKTIPDFPPGALNDEGEG